MLGGEADARELLDRLVARVGADPASTAGRQVPYLPAKRHLDELGSLDDQRGRAAADQPPRQGHLFTRLVETKTTGTGVVRLTYQPAGDQAEG